MYVEKDLKSERAPIRARTNQCFQLRNRYSAHKDVWAAQWWMKASKQCGENRRGPKTVLGNTKRERGQRSQPDVKHDALISQCESNDCPSITAPGNKFSTPPAAIRGAASGGNPTKH